MHEKLLKKIKKKKGTAGVITILLISLLVMSFMFAYFVMNINPIKRRTDAETICRKYALTLEQQGYLTPENEYKMISDFNNIGINNINLNGTTMSQVQYGDDVCLNVTYADKIKKVVMGRGIIPSFQDQSVTVPISKKTVSTKAHY